MTHDTKQDLAQAVQGQALSDELDYDNLQALTSQPLSDGAVHPNKSGWRLRSASGLAASLLIAGSLLLTSCGDDDDCIVSTPPAAASSGTGYFGPTPVPGSAPSTPASAQFTAGATNTGQTYCRSRRTGGYYYSSGGGYRSGSSSGGSSSSGSSSS